MQSLCHDYGVDHPPCFHPFLTVGRSDSLNTFYKSVKEYVIRHNTVTHQREIDPVEITPETSGFIERSLEGLVAGQFATQVARRSCRVVEDMTRPEEILHKILVHVAILRSWITLHLVSQRDDYGILRGAGGGKGWCRVLAFRKGKESHQTYE